MRHIFGEQFDLGLKYEKVLYRHPKQALPILTLISQLRGTGKSTFVDWQNQIFGNNMVVITPQDIGSGFNSSYATKNIIAIEESRFESIQATEKLKALATQKKILVNGKYVPEYSVPFFGKLIITSNDEHKFSKVDMDEIRYWIRLVPEIKDGLANHNILEDLNKEIPYFLWYLSNMVEDIDLSQSRQVFTTDQLETKALKNVKNESKPELQKEIEMLIDEWCVNNKDVPVLHFTSGDIKERFFLHDSRTGRAYVHKVLRFNMGLEVTEPIRYKLFLDTNGATKVGRCFIIENPYALNKQQELPTETEWFDPLP